MSGKVIEFMKQQKYRFDFGTDDKLYVITFNGKIPQREIRKMLESVQNSSYGNMAGAIESYLKQHHLVYSNPVSIEIPLENDVMDWANHLLNSENCKKLDGNIEDADVFYAVMDYQNISPDGHCEGCYFAVGRLVLGYRKYKYNIIAQTCFSKGISVRTSYLWISFSPTPYLVLITLSPGLMLPAMLSVGTSLNIKK